MSIPDYTPRTWINGPDGTPFNAQSMNNIEQQVAAVTPALQQSVDKIHAFGEISLSLNTYGGDPGDPTGVADSRAALQALVDAVPYGGRAIIPPGGTYACDNAVFLRSNMRIDGYGAEIIKNPGSTRYTVFVALSTNLVTNVEIAGFRFRGNFAEDQSLCVLAANKASNIRIIQCEMIECQITGHTFDLCGCDGVALEDCIWRGQRADGGRAETVEIDIYTATSVSYPDTGYDATMTKNVTIVRGQFLPLVVDGVKHPSPIPLGGHAVWEGKYYENIRILDSLVVDPRVDPSSSAINVDNPFIKGLVHLPTVKTLVVDMKVVATDGLGNCRPVMVSSVSSGTLATSDPAGTQVEGAWAEPVISEDIRINLTTIGLLGTGSALDPLIGMIGSSAAGCYVKNVDITMNCDGTYKEAVMLRYAQKVNVKFTNCGACDTAVRAINSKQVTVQGNLEKVRIPVRWDGSTGLSVSALTLTSSIPYDRVVYPLNGGDYVAVNGVVGQGYSGLVVPAATHQAAPASANLIYA